MAHGKTVAVSTVTSVASTSSSLRVGGHPVMTYTTLDGRVLDLSGLTGEERAFLDRCAAAYRDGVTWVTLSRLVEGAENPLVRAEGGRITRSAWDHPLFQAIPPKIPDRPTPRPRRRPGGRRVRGAADFHASWCQPTLA